MITKRAAKQGEGIKGMAVQFPSMRWEGEFHAVYGDRKVSNFLSECSEAATEILLELDSGECISTDYIRVMMDAA